MSSNLEQSTAESGKAGSETDTERFFGRMALSTRESGSSAKLTDEASSSTQTVMSTRGSGETTCRMAKALTDTKTGLSSSVSGSSICSMDLELRSGLMDRRLKGCMRLERSRGLGSTCGTMGRCTSVTGRTT